MPCDMRSYEKMAEDGWTDDEIELLKKEIELARRIAERQASQRGKTLAQQQNDMKVAEKQARVVAHDRHHRKEKAQSDELLGAIALLRPAHISEPVAVHARHDHHNPAEGVGKKGMVFDLPVREDSEEA